MATNKFATMLERKSNRIIVILVYAVLEWILIILLLLNSLFSYLIAKFVDYFGLKPPCSWCSRIDHGLSPASGSNSYRNNMCEAHAAEISRLGYCSNHRKLAESESMCMDCLASGPSQEHEHSETAARIDFIGWASKERLEDGGKALRCSCCNGSLMSVLYPPYWMLEPSWDATLKYTQKEDLVVNATDNKSNGSDLKEICRRDGLAAYSEDNVETERNDEQDHLDDAGKEDGSQMLNDGGSSRTRDDYENSCSMTRLNLQSDLKEVEGNLGTGDGDETMCYTHENNNLLEIIGSGRETALELTCTIPPELIDLPTVANHVSWSTKKASLKSLDNRNKVSRSEEVVEEAPALEDATLRNQERTNPEEVNRMVPGKQKQEVVDIEEIMEDLVQEVCKQVITLKVSQALSNGVNFFDGLELTESDFPSEPIREKNSSSSTIVAVDGSLRSFHASMPLEELGLKLEEETDMRPESTSVDKNRAERKHRLVLLHSDPNEAEEEKLPETPSSYDCMHNLHKKLLLDKRETGTDESIDGSAVSESEGGDPVLSIERLKTTLKAKQKAPSALYSELAEERSASAIAANQTMAMINRLQEEKAAVQMEALQYQRMMEEQSQYDQEALQLLNELMIKREKEKHELEIELEAYRNRVSDYEAKEEVRIVRSIKNRSSSATCSNADDIDIMAMNLTHETKDEHGSFLEKDGNIHDVVNDEVTNLQEVASDCVKQMTALDDLLAEFEEERASILDQLTILEEKLLNLKSNDQVEEVNSTERFYHQYTINEFDASYELDTPKEDGISSDMPDLDIYSERKTMGFMAKRLLPLLDAVDDDAEKFMFKGTTKSEALAGEYSSLSLYEQDSEMINIEEVVDHVYKRLQALEADREFMKHCMSSIQKGDKGMDLLQEILQHLRDLNAVELDTRDMTRSSGT